MKNDLYSALLDYFIPSDDMRIFLERQNLPKDTFLDLILGSINPLEVKLEWIRKIHNETPDRSTKEIVEDIEDALNYLEEGTAHIFTIEEINNKYNKSIFACPAKNRRKIEESISYSDDENFPWDYPVTWEVKEWNLDDYGVGKYSFLYAKPEESYLHSPIFFRKRDFLFVNEGRYFDLDDSKKIHRYAGNVRNLRLPIPFHPGEKLSVWGLPFEDCREVLLVCNLPEQQLALSFNNDGTERIINFTKGKTWLNNLHHYGVSPYYRMTKSRGNTLSTEQLERFLEVSKQIAGSNENGKAFAETVKCR